MSLKPAKADPRTLWIKARVRQDELAVIEMRAARANRTISEFIRDSALAALPEPRGLTAVERHDLARIAVEIKKSATEPEMLRALQNLIRRIEDGL